MAAPKYVLIAGNEDDKKEFAKVQAKLEDETKARKAAEEDKEKAEAKLKASDDEDKLEKAKKAIKAIFDEKDDDKKTEATKAMKEIFETGNGVNTNAKKATDEEKEKTAVMKALTARAAEPIINKILSAKQIAGAKPEDLTKEKTRLSALTLTALDSEFESNKIFIESSLAASSIPMGESLEASIEKSFEFNGAHPLTGSVINLDEVLSEAQL